MKQEEMVEKLKSKFIRRSQPLNDHQGFASASAQSSSAPERDRPWALPPVKPTVQLSPNTSIWNLCQPAAPSTSSASTSARASSNLTVEPLPLPNLIQAQNGEPSRPSTPYLMLLAAIENAKAGSARKQEIGQQTGKSISGSLVAGLAPHAGSQPTQPVTSAPRQTTIQPSGPASGPSLETASIKPRRSKLPRLRTDPEPAATLDLAHRTELSPAKRASTTDSISHSCKFCPICSNFWVQHADNACCQLCQTHPNFSISWKICVIATQKNPQ